MSTTKELLTESRLKAFRRCPREHQYRYWFGYRPVSEGIAVKLGSLIHHALEAWWRHGSDRYAFARMAIAEYVGDLDAFERVKVEEMIRGYDARWGDEQFTVLGVEEEFRAPLVNPETQAASRTYELAGKLDVRVLDKHGRRIIIEHKSAGSADHGSAYWERLKLDGQISGYLNGAKSLGHEAEACVYDVLVKPGLRPLKATPPESRKYKKGTNELYANQRERDESPEEYRLRVREEIATHPDDYFQRCEIVRLESEVLNHELETWVQAVVMREQKRLGIAPMNTDSCIRFGQKCAFFDVCSNAASLTDETRFVQLCWPHSELTPPKEEANHEHESPQAG